MVRQIVKIDDRNFNLALPAEFIGKKVEILAFVVDENAGKEDVSYLTESDDEFVVFEVDTKGYKFDREEANER